MNTVMLIVVAMIVVAVVFVGAAFVLGFQVGGRFWQSQLQRTRFDAARAERQLHDLTREAFVAMADHAEDRSEQ